jgi:NADH-quinone oxidoreductase subunit J
VMVLYVFVVSYVGGAEEPLDQAGVPRALAPIFGGALLVVFALAIGGSLLKGLDGQGGKLYEGFGTPGAIGEALLTTYLLPFEVASYILTVAAVGAVMLSRRRRGLAELDDHGKAEKKQ